MADDIEKGYFHNWKGDPSDLSNTRTDQATSNVTRNDASSSSRRSRSLSPPVVDSARPCLSVFRFKHFVPVAFVSCSTPAKGASSFRPNSPSSPSSAFGNHVPLSHRRSKAMELLLEAANTSTLEVIAKRRQTEIASTTAPEPKRMRSSGGGVVQRRRLIPEMEGKGSVVLSWANLTVASRDGKKILHDLNGQVHAGFTAIMGPSGSGKSTLLNTLACRMDKSASVQGQIRLNGMEYTNADLKKMSGYVMQDDLLNAHLTVEETLLYTVKLKLEPTYTDEQLQARVNEVIKQMGLEQCRKTVIGSALRKGISGGERKRVSVGMEVLTRPQLLFLDEPTSGLDSMTALHLCTLLRKIADERDCTVICTIHQPQAKIFNLFQSLIILKAGKLIYQGSAPGVLNFFEESGFPCPEFTNPADHLLDVISSSVEPNEKRNDDTNEEKLRSHFVADPVDLDEGAEYPPQLNRERMPWHRQYMVLLNRGIKEQFRRRNVVITQVIQNILTAVLIGGVFFQIGDGPKSTVRRQPVLFFCVINQGVFGALTVINSFPSERILILRERAAGMYYSSAYYMAKMSAEMPFQILSPMIFSLVVYFMVGFQRKARKFFLFMFFMILCQLSATSLALATSAICRTTDLSVTVLPMLLEINRLFGGFFLAPKILPRYFIWLDCLSYVKYCYVAISQSELKGLELSCKPSDLDKQGKCVLETGEQTIKRLGLDYLTVAECAVILMLYIVVTRTFAYLGIRYIKN
ncbi:hypothetical protein R1flu_016831 [Riccia fluitans]|uniref:ABC transporter domain-containing protein n=1 Tax=Riccia fluitans TaxID=41844 RepID=A0ABD1YNB7_9MARC